MKKIILVSWLIIVLSFSGLFVSSIVYEIDAWYTMVNFKFELHEINIVKNSTEDIVSMRASATITNPSRISSFTLYSIRVSVSLNNQKLLYISNSLKWYYLDVPPQENKIVSWGYLDLQQADVDILNAAESEGTWNWFLNIRVTLISGFLGTEDYDRSQSFLGVNFISI
ncbi:MAG: hypothetical protein ACFFB2_03645 [Promethearchaeota archaeon]